MKSNYKVEIAENTDRDAEIAYFIAYERVAKGSFPGIIFVDEKKHGSRLAAAVATATGCTTPMVTSDTPQRERARMIRLMNAKDPSMPVVVATTVWATGINIPHLQWVALGGSKISAPIMALQPGGRGLRRPDGKESCEVINIIDEGRYGAAGERRTEHLANAGYTVSDEEFVRTIPAAPEAARRETQDSGGGGQASKSVSIPKAFMSLVFEGLIWMAIIVVVGQAVTLCSG